MPVLYWFVGSCVFADSCTLGGFTSIAPQMNLIFFSLSLGLNAEVGDLQ